MIFEIGVVLFIMYCGYYCGKLIEIMIKYSQTTGDKNNG